jgi:Uma2 family endonuclease
MSGALKRPDAMTLGEFLVWDAPDGPPWQLVDGEPIAMPPANPSHALIQSRIVRRIEEHLESKATGSLTLSNPGVRLGRHTDSNFRIPDVGVTCSPLIRGDIFMPDPVLLVEILSPSNQRETWWNVWDYTTIPSVREILVVRAAAIGAHLLRRNSDGSWPEVPLPIEGDAVLLESIGLSLNLPQLYAGTPVA